ncbi:hypothetical protein PI125_g22340 [Phytophthora idaei]|nr:hypothetical protein PI125_g22340 [Phytophthora idaei]KAG3135437.1 hypothetical protein PI126_g18254 [Phytophthora idaei]
MAPARRVQKIKAADSSTESGSEESDSDPDSHPRICLAAGEDRASKGVDGQKRAEPSQRDRRLVDPVVGTVGPTDLGTIKTRPIQSVALSADHESTQSPDVGDI